MCGYVRRVTNSPAVRELLEEIGLESLAGEFEEAMPASGDTIEHFYPAFGGTPRYIRKLIVSTTPRPMTVDAVWWFDCEAEGDSLKVGKRTTFNARNLDSPYWTGALRHHRGLVVATGLGESKIIDGKKHQYLMQAQKPFLLGALFRPFPNGCFSCAIITRESHPRFDQFHDKAFPCFLPADPDFVDLWLNHTADVPGPVAAYLEHPKLVVPLRVSEVKTFKGGSVAADAFELLADP